MCITWRIYLRPVIYDTRPFIYLVHGKRIITPADYCFMLPTHSTIQDITSFLLMNGDQTDFLCAKLWLWRTGHPH